MRLRTSGSVTVANCPHAGHSKSANSITCTGALGFPRRYPSAWAGVAFTSVTAEAAESWLAVRAMSPTPTTATMPSPR